MTRPGGAAEKNFRAAFSFCEIFWGKSVYSNRGGESLLSIINHLWETLEDGRGRARCRRYPAGITGPSIGEELSMRGLLTALGRKLRLIRPCGCLEISPCEPRGEGSFTVGGPSFVLNEKGVEGPLYPSLWDDLSWYSGAPRPCVEAGPAPREAAATAPDKPMEGEDQTGPA